MAESFTRTQHTTPTDTFQCSRFHHVEFYCADATNVYKRLQHGLGMGLVARSDLSTGNARSATYVLQSNELVFAFSAPYATTSPSDSEASDAPATSFDQEHAFDFVKRHGLAVRAVGLRVADAAAAYEACTTRGAVGVLAPTARTDEGSQTAQTTAEVELYGDVVLRFVSGDFQGPFLAGMTPTEGEPEISYGLQRLDHAVGNVPDLAATLAHVRGFTGFHEFAEFTAEDVGTVDSGLNSVVLASDNEMVLLPVNEPTHGTKRKSQIQTYLEQNLGPGVQHLALKTDDIFSTLRAMRARSQLGGLEFMPRPSDKYYRQLPEKVEGALSAAQLEEAEELGLLVDKDDQGVLLQIFTKPLSDRPTIFLEIIQRVGCEYKAVQDDGQEVVQQKGGCGGFGKGNFTELFKSIEEYERTLKV